MNRGGGEARIFATRVDTVAKKKVFSYKPLWKKGGRKVGKLKVSGAGTGKGGKRRKNLHVRGKK